jgi:hypothetical protein
VPQTDVGEAAVSPAGPNDVELDAASERVIVDRSGVCCATAKALVINLSCPCKVVIGNRRERPQFDVVDFNC